MSVSRINSQAQTKQQKQLSTALFKALAHYHQAEEFSHFSSQLSKETRLDLARGKHLYAALQQPPEQLFSLPEQQLMLETIMLSTDDRPIDVIGLKNAVPERAKDAKTDEDYDRIEAELLAQFAPAPLKEAAPAGQSSETKSTEENTSSEKEKPTKDEKVKDKKEEKK